MRRQYVNLMDGTLSDVPIEDVLGWGSVTLPEVVRLTEEGAKFHVDKIDLKGNLFYHVDFEDPSSLFQITTKKVAARLKAALPDLLGDSPFKVEQIYMNGPTGFNTICITVDNKNPALQTVALGEKILRLVLDAMQPPRKAR